MSLRYRPMRPKDVAECVKIIASNPVIGARYGSAISELHQAWLRLVGCEAMRTVVYEDVHEARVKTWGMGVGVFVHDDFMREIKTPPLGWFGPQLARRVVRGNSPVLSDKEVREANSKGGLSLLVWEACPNAEFAKRPEAFHLMVTAFLELHCGYLCKEAITAQAESAARLHWSMDAGACCGMRRKGVM